MFAMLALGSAALYGAADFIGGMMSRRADTVAIVLVSQAAGLVLIACFVVAEGTPAPPLVDAVWGGVAGVAGGLGVALLYRALAVGVMAVVAPITAVCAVVVPVTIAVLLGERPAWSQGAGIVLAMGAVVLVSQQPSAREAGSSTLSRRSGLSLALAAGVAIGLFFFALAQTSAEAGLWPLVAARLSSVMVFGAIAALTQRALHMERRVTILALTGGVLDMLANLLYLLATRHGPLTLAVTLSSLYPASTILLAWVVLRERLAPQQWVGVALALAAILMIVA